MADDGTSSTTSSNTPTKEPILAGLTNIQNLRTGTGTGVDYIDIVNSNFIDNKNNTNNANNANNNAAGEIIDIVSNYPWTVDSMRGSYGNVTNVPHCYVIEYKQGLSSSITNLINSIAAFGNSNNEEFMKSVSGFVGELGGGITDFVNKIGTNLKNNLDKLAGKISNGISTSSDYLSPYRLLYDLDPTGKKYCFPMISNPPVLSLKNTFSGETDTGMLTANKFFAQIGGLATTVTKTILDIKQLTDLAAGRNETSQYERVNIEKSKFFQYPSDTDSYTVTFPLINTAKSDKTTVAWKKNYKFILLFCLRNMIYRKDNTTYYPPLFYDLIIPGVIRQPFTYVENVNITPIGMVRMLKLENDFNFMEKADKEEPYSVPVPEAWIMTITFKSLIATSANLVISAFTDSCTSAVKSSNNSKQSVVTQST